MASLDDSEFHPDDPTVGLWKRLLRRYPGKGTYRPRTAVEKRNAAVAVQQYYTEHEHPRQGIQPGSE